MDEFQGSGQAQRQRTGRRLSPPAAILREQNRLGKKETMSA